MKARRATDAEIVRGLGLGRENFKRVTEKGGCRCERFDRTLSVVLKSLSQGFYRTFLGPKKGFR